jgi:hypothetical protein
VWLDVWWCVMTERRQVGGGFGGTPVPARTEPRGEEPGQEKEVGLPFRARTVEAAGMAARAAAGTSALLAVAGMAGWVFDIEALKSVLPTQSSSMKPNTAVGLLLLGVSLLVLLSGPRSRGLTLAARIGAGVAVCIGAVTLFEYAGGTDLGVDQLLFRDDTWTDTSPAGRMAPNAALALILAGAAAIAVRSPRPRAWPAPRRISPGC